VVPFLSLLKFSFLLPQDFSLSAEERKDSSSFAAASFRICLCATDFVQDCGLDAQSRIEHLTLSICIHPPEQELIKSLLDVVLRSCLRKPASPA